MSNLVSARKRPGWSTSFGSFGVDGAVADLQPALDLRLELDGLGLGGAGRAEEQRGDLAIERVLLEEERELAALVDLDRVLELVRC